MATSSYADTTEMIQVAKDLKKLSDDLDFEIKTLFSRLINVPNGTKEWIGDEANIYFNLIAEDKTQYLVLSRCIRSLSVEILGEADELENIATKDRRN